MFEMFELLVVQCYIKENLFIGGDKKSKFESCTGNSNTKTVYGARLS